MGEIGSHARKNHDTGGDSVANDRLTFAPAFGALEDFVWRYADQRGNDFRERQLMAVAFPVLAHVRCDARGRHAVRDLSLIIQLESQRGWKAFLRRAVGSAADNDRHDRPLRAPMLEDSDFLINITASDRSGRAEDDQGGGSIKRRDCLILQGQACAKIIAVAENGMQRLRNVP